jgi:hypothetical protein
MMSSKELMARIIEEQPDDSSYDEILQELALARMIERGLATLDETRAWQEAIPDSELLVLPGDSYHVAASEAEQCAQATLAFIQRKAPPV